MALRSLLTRTVTWRREKNYDKATTRHVAAEAESGEEANAAFDFVIVGSGSAGCAAAAHLSRLLPKCSIAVIDEGTRLDADGSFIERLAASVPAMSLHRHVLLSNRFQLRETVAQESLGNRRLVARSARVVGGESEVGDVAHVRGPASDYETLLAEGFAATTTAAVGDVPSTGATKPSSTSWDVEQVAAAWTQLCERPRSWGSAHSNGRGAPLAAAHRWDINRSNSARKSVPPAPNASANHADQALPSTSSASAATSCSSVAPLPLIPLRTPGRNLSTGVPHNLAFVAAAQAAGLPLFDDFGDARGGTFAEEGDDDEPSEATNNLLTASERDVQRQRRRLLGQLVDEYEGVCPVTSAVGPDARRRGAFSALLLPLLNDVGGLDGRVCSGCRVTLLSGTRATRLIWESTAVGTFPTIVGVEVEPSSRKTSSSEKGRSADRRRVVTVRRELLLTGGAYRTPELLLRSGVGDAATVAKWPTRGRSAHGEGGVVAHVPDVGRNLSEQLSVDLVAWAGSPKPSRCTTPTNWAFLFQQWRTYNAATTTSATDDGGDERGGETIFSSAHEWIAYVRARREDRRTGLSLRFSPNVTHGPEGGWPLPIAGYTCHVTLLRPQSRGSVTLESGNGGGDDLLRLDPQVCQQGTNDLESLGEGVAWAQFLLDPAHGLKSTMFPGQYGDESPFRQFNPEMFLPKEPMFKAPSREIFVKQRCYLAGKAFGTCAINRVVDGELRVKGVRGVRVADSSVCPAPMASSPSTLGLLLGRKAAELIAAAQLKQS